MQNIVLLSHQRVVTRLRGVCCMFMCVSINIVRLRRIANNICVGLWVDSFFRYDDKLFKGFEPMDVLWSVRKKNKHKWFFAGLKPDSGNMRVMVSCAICGCCFHCGCVCVI